MRHKVVASRGGPRPLRGARGPGRAGGGAHFRPVLRQPELELGAPLVEPLELREELGALWLSLGLGLGLGLGLSLGLGLGLG